MNSKLGQGWPLAALIAVTCVGCSSGKPADPAPITKSASNAPPAKAAAASGPRVTNRPANPTGQVYIVAYHHILAGKGMWFRTPDQFRSDLEWFYDKGFRPVTLSEYLGNKMPLPPGASPVVLTFDDADPTQFKMNPDGSIDPNCGVGIWQAFAKQHPDFPVHGTFFVLPDMWSQSQVVKQKVDWLDAAGSELGNHTITHPSLRKLTDEKVKWEIGLAAEKLEALGQKPPFSLAYPFGVSPKNKSLLDGFDFDGKHVEIKSALLVGANPAPMSTSKKFLRYRIPRIVACTVPFGLDYWKALFEKGKVKVYVAP